MSIIYKIRKENKEDPLRRLNTNLFIPFFTRPGLRLFLLPPVKHELLC